MYIVQVIQGNKKRTLKIIKIWSCLAIEPYSRQQVYWPI